MTAAVRVLAAHDESLVDDLVRIIDAAYAVGEDGLWLDGASRVRADEIAAAVRSGGMLAPTRDDRLVGCAYVRPLDGRTADLGLISTAPDEWGRGIGGELIRAAEELMRARRVTEMQLELLVPKDGVHPAKARLRSWYERLGYRVARSAPFEQVAAHLAPKLAVPCEFLIFRKPLT